MRLLLRFLGAALVAFSTVDSALSCSIAGGPSPAEMVAGAELIVRATAVDYSVSPKIGVPNYSRIRFRVESVLKGTYGAANLVLPGFLSERDDWNDQTPPYRFVRPAGLGGTCVADSYRRGGQFLLMLKRVSPTAASDTEYTVNWDALGPVNEQLRSPEDAWVQWVRSQLQKP